MIRKIFQSSFTIGGLFGLGYGIYTGPVEQTGLISGLEYVAKYAGAGCLAGLTFPISTPYMLDAFRCHEVDRIHNHTLDRKGTTFHRE